MLRARGDRGLIEEAGRDEAPGRPVLYATTPEFLERLGLPSLASLPSLAPLLGVDELAEEEGVHADDVADANLEDDSATDEADIPEAELETAGSESVGEPGEETVPSAGTPDADPA